jgi:hypothetical protein
MLIDYQISERDYIHGEIQVFRPRTDRKDVPMTVGFSLAGLLCIGEAIRGFARSGFAAGQVFLALFGLLVLFCFPLLKSVLSRGIRKHARTIYRNTAWLHGRLFLDVNEGGVQFTFEGHSMTAQWADFTRFFEDRRTFILHQRNPQSPPPFIFHIVPKHNLSPDQIKALREYLQSNVGKRTGLRASPTSGA